MTDHKPRLFESDGDIRRTGEGLLSRTLPRAEWTHEAHLASCLWLLRDRTDIAPERDLPDIIRGYNASVGGVNSDTEGYHETITQAYIRLIRAWLRDNDNGNPLVERVNAMLASPLGHRAVLLNHWSKDRLFSVEARRNWVEPDVKPLDAGIERPQPVS